MEKAAFVAYTQREKKRINDFYELCKLFSDVWNAATPENKVHPQRFMRDCKANRRAYELAEIDFKELTNMPDLEYKLREPKAKAKLLFGRLKARKAELNASNEEASN